MELIQFAGRALPDTERPCRSLSLFLIRSLFLSSPPGKWLRFEGCRANQPVPTLRRLKIKKLFVVICLNIPWPDLRLNEQGDLGRFCHAFRIYPRKFSLNAGFGVTLLRCDSVAPSKPTSQPGGLNARIVSSHHAAPKHIHARYGSNRAKGGNPLMSRKMDGGRRKWLKTRTRCHAFWMRLFAGQTPISTPCHR